MIGVLLIRGMPLKEIMGLSPFFFLSGSLPGFKVNSFALPGTPTMMCCLITGLKATGSVNHGMKTSKNKPFLFIN
jgi:hypothetical protein